MYLSFLQKSSLACVPITVLIQFTLENIER